MLVDQLIQQLFQMHPRSTIKTDQMINDVEQDTTTRGNDCSGVCVCACPDNTFTCSDLLTVSLQPHVLHHQKNHRNEREEKEEEEKATVSTATSRTDEKRRSHTLTHTHTHTHTRRCSPVQRERAQRSATVPDLLLVNAHRGGGGYAHMRL